VPVDGINKLINGPVHTTVAKIKDAKNRLVLSSVKVKQTSRTRYEKARLQLGKGSALANGVGRSYKSRIVNELKGTLSALSKGTAPDLNRLGALSQDPKFDEYLLEARNRLDPSEQRDLVAFLNDPQNAGLLGHVETKAIKETLIGDPGLFDQVMLDNFKDSKGRRIHFDRLLRASSADNPRDPDAMATKKIRSALLRARGWANMANESVTDLRDKLGFQATPKGQRLAKFVSAVVKELLIEHQSDMVVNGVINARHGTQQDKSQAQKEIRNFCDSTAGARSQNFFRSMVERFERKPGNPLSDPIEGASNKAWLKDVFHGDDIEP
jgi:hypothetical protein